MVVYNSFRALKEKKKKQWDLEVDEELRLLLKIQK